MGGTGWSKPEEPPQNEESISTIETLDDFENVENEIEVEINSRETREKELDDFKKMIDDKREQRKLAMAKISEELNKLRESNEELEQERTIRCGLEKQIKALKEVTVVSNEMLRLRETQVTELKKRLDEMETSAQESLVELRNQYEKQIENIHKLRRLYEERAEATARTHERELEKERAKVTLLELRLNNNETDNDDEEDKNKQISELSEKLKEKESNLEILKSELRSSIAECKTVTSQIMLINNLFSNMLTGNELDFDFLTKLLQDNHNLIIDLISNGDMNETVALLFNIAEQVYKKSNENITDNSEMTTIRDEIASNLPKVWRVLIELLSQYEESIHTVTGTSEQCYRHVQTKNGEKTVISASETFIRLKDLILEKNGLMKEVSRLKTLNGHLENRLETQEKRLGVVTSELKKTWRVVSKLKLQHQQLHTHERVLLYELQNKRQMLTDLKQELEYCKETWNKARQKNKQSEHDWEILRKEFALRKSNEASNSAESGYEDDSAEISTELEYDLETEEGSAASEETVENPEVTKIIHMLNLEQDGQSHPSGVEDMNPETLASPENREVPTEDSDSAENSNESVGRNAEEFADARSLRLQRLEQQCRSLLNQMALTSFRSDSLSARLEELHEIYGSEDRNDAIKGETCQDTSSELEECKTDDFKNEEISDKKLPTSNNSNEEPDNKHSNEIEESTSTRGIDYDHKLQSRADRLQRMEEQCLQLFEKMAKTSQRSDTISSKLEQLHEIYGNPQPLTTNTNTNGNGSQSGNSTTTEKNSNPEIPPLDTPNSENKNPTISEQISPTNDQATTQVTDIIPSESLNEEGSAL